MFSCSMIKIYYPINCTTFSSGFRFFQYFFFTPDVVDSHSFKMVAIPSQNDFD